MKTKFSSYHSAKGVILALLGVILAVPMLAFPPAPHHVFRGVVRDQYGTPWTSSGAEVVLETTTGVTRTAPIIFGLKSGINYELTVPMDAGVTLIPYSREALVTRVPFKIRVIIDGVAYLPIEMMGDFSRLGEAGKSTRLDLTLGVDADGDGLPDAWEQTLIQRLGLNGLADVNPGDDADDDGMTNLEEYSSGNFAFDENDGLVLHLAGFNRDHPVLEFLAVRGRTYRVMESADLRVWNPVAFIIQADGADGADAAAREHYVSDAVRTVRVEVPQTLESDAKRFFRLMVQ